MSKSTLSILFLDNSRTTRAGMSMILTGQGFEVASVASGPEAIEKLKTGSFDVLVSDLYMPLMNGHEVAKTIRALPDKINTIPIVILTASEDPKDRELCQNAGVNHFVVKTEDHQSLFGILKQYQTALAKLS